jgi:nicotinate-nucleotide adenylyltransferase
MTGNSSQGPLGIMGGAFDPVHFGHLRTAVELSEHLQLSELRFVPSANPPHRAAHIASGDQRVSMLEAALTELSWCSVDDRELTRQGPSWSVVTLEELRSEIGERSLCMILGMDAFLGLPDWHRWNELLGLAHIVVAYRPGSQPPMGGPMGGPMDGPVGELLATHGTTKLTDIQNTPAGRILVQEVTQLEISSSAIRDLLLHEQGARYLTPAGVLKIIEATGCYATHAAEAKQEQHQHAK